MIIYCNYFSDPKIKRREEYLYCLDKNQSLDFVKKVYVFLESESDQDDILNTDKLEFIVLGRRMDFKDVFDHAQQHIEPGTILAILNLDIFIEDNDAWRNIDRDFFQIGYPKKSMVLKRTDLLDFDGTTYIEKSSWEVGRFCDGWVFKSPIESEFLNENFNFCVGGAPYCDNLMMYLMTKHYHTYSWGAKYRTFHVDICRKPGRPGLMVRNEKTDYRAQERKKEHARIPAYQDWDFLLENQQQPNFILF